jgi:hypothetical protein
MFTSALFQAIATARLEQCATFEGGTVFVRLPDRRFEARMTTSDWAAIIERHHGAVRESRGQWRILMLGTIPLALVILGITVNVPALNALLNSSDRAVPFILPFLITSGLPIVAIVRHVRAVLRSVDRARLEIDSFPRVVARHRAPARDAGPLLKVGIFAIVPLLLIQTYGSINPDAYRNTPWTGTRLGPVSLVLALALLGLLVARWRASHLASAAAEESGLARTDVIAARAHGGRSEPS